MIEVIALILGCIATFIAIMDKSRYHNIHGQ